jgi:hypothetical protein
MVCCIDCDLDLDISEFYDRKSYCKKCDILRLKSKYDLETFNELLNKLQICDLCNENISILYFSKVKDKCICKNCLRQYTLNCKKENYNQTYKEYYNNNREKQVIKATKWNNNNKDKRKEHKKTYRAKHKNEINFRIKENLSTRLRGLVKKNGKTLIDFLDCSIDYFKKWIEFNFTEDMSWTNYGTYWQFDHVQPCASFNFSNEIETKQCWVWYNIFPLKSQENAKKFTKINHTYINFVEQQKIKFLETDLINNISNLKI